MKKNGFTLIELLAVIVILAIIALIATPIVLNIIEDTKNSATLRSADFYLDAVELSIAKSVLDGGDVDGEYTINSNGNICRNVSGEESCLEVEVQGQKPTSGKIIVEDGNIKEVSKLTFAGFSNKAIEKDGNDLVIVEFNKDMQLINEAQRFIDAFENIIAGEEILEVYFYFFDYIEFEIMVPTDLKVYEMEFSGKRPIKISGMQFQGDKVVGGKIYYSDGIVSIDSNGNLSMGEYTILYTNISNVEGLPTGVKHGKSLTIDLTNKGLSETDIVVRNSGREISNYTYKNGILTIPNVSMDINVIGITDLGTSSLAQHIENLYNEGTKTESLQINGIKYNMVNIDGNYGLINDRLGSSSVLVNEGNIRYYGYAPNNYVDIGDRDSRGQIIYWRIIGLFKDITVVNDNGTTSTQDLIKIVRDDALPVSYADGSGTTPYFSWDYSSTGAPYNNNWTESQLMTMLNSDNGYYGSGSSSYDYYNEFWNNNSGETEVKHDIYNFTSAGLSENVRSKIAKVRWNLGGGVYTDYVNSMYSKERAGDLTWDGKIALMYPSDYGYASDLSGCNEPMSEYSENYDMCVGKNWLVPYSNEYYTLTYDGGISFGSSQLVVIKDNNTVIGHVTDKNALTKPVLYLKADTKLLGEVVTPYNRYYKLG